MARTTTLTVGVPPQSEWLTLVSVQVDKFVPLDQLMQEVEFGKDVPLMLNMDALDYLRHYILSESAHSHTHLKLLDSA